MDASWLSQYPRAAALLQGADEVLDYAPQSSAGLEEPEALDEAAALAAYRRVFGEDPPDAAATPDRGDW